MLVEAKGPLYAVALIMALVPAVAFAEPATPGPLDRAMVALGPDTPSARCVQAVDQQQQQQQRQTKRRARRGVLGWLSRYTRNVDIERSSSPLPLYLRTPLLAAGPLPECEESRPDSRVEQCAVIALNPDGDDSVTITAALPQLEALTPAGLGDAIRMRLDRGERVTLRTSSGSDLELLSDRIRTLDARTCIVDA